jgi:hypothetical protein
MKLIVSIDTEADNQWDYGRPLTTRNVCYWRPFQKLCEQYGILPTYLITSEIATDPRAIAFLGPLVKTERAEVGAHLHPWTTPPFRDEPGLRFNDCVHAFPSQLDPQLLQDKLFVLTRQITQATGSPPRSFRAGRFGFNSSCAEALSFSGFEADSSVTPLVSWKHQEGMPGCRGGPDFRRKPVHPTWIIEDSQNKLLEVPLTILLTIPWLRQFPSLLPLYRSLSGKLSHRASFKRRLLPQPLWLRPFAGTTIKHLCTVWNEAERIGLPVVVMMFHSSELMPGGSAYRPTQSSVHKLLRLLEEFFRFVQKNGGETITMTEAARMLTPTLQQENRA